MRGSSPGNRVNARIPESQNDAVLSRLNKPGNRARDSAMTLLRTDHGSWNHGADASKGRDAWDDSKLPELHCGAEENES
ncbi:hypothetical protein PVK06_036664 [Gossypium arboreum]|uniref:Uncharacterized protein n=1 Tax=Gossypium arboreum TaxID=29729 RepID=A0ABR0NKI0_GOSAR|nr:hypothetical protein PVK06_036664 [Gossypium arboreum]